MTDTIFDKLSLFFFSIIILIVGYIFYAYITGQFETHKSWVNSFDINKQDIIVSASENELLLWDSRKCKKRLVGHSDAIKTVAFSHNGLQIASGSIDKLIKVWSLSSQKLIKTLNGHKEGVSNVKFSNNDKYLISVGNDNKLLIWDLKNNKIIKVFDIKLTNFSINNQDILAYIDTSCSLNLFDLKSMSDVKFVGHFCGFPEFSPQNNVVAVNGINESVITFIDIPSKKVLSTINFKKGHFSQVSSFKFTPDGQYIVASLWGGDIEIWNWQQKKLIRTLRGHILNSVDCLLFNNKNQLISGSGDKSLKYWNWENGDLKMIVGDGLFKSKLNGLLSISIFITLIVGFFAIISSNKNKLSSNIVFAILTTWSFGFSLILYFFKTTIYKYSSPIIWITTIVSGLFFLSLYGSWLAIYTIPISLLFCYFNLTSNIEKEKIYLPLLINLVFSGILCSFVTSVGLWK